MADSKESMEERGRKDYTEDTEISERRLDTLARLLACHSICTAVAVINNTFLVSANELSQKSREINKNLSAIKSVIDYFSDLAKKDTKVTQEKRQQLFEKICTKDRLSINNITITIPNGLPEKIAARIINGDNPRADELSKSYGKDAPAAFSLWAFGMRNFKDFTKFEEGISKKIDNAYKEGLADEALTALEKKEIELLKNESSSGVHAELQILSRIVQMINESNIDTSKKQTIYIGVSKLCCMDCRAMIEVANEVFKEKQIQITLETRGHHDLDFSKWKCPDLFSDGYNGLKGKGIKNDSIEYLIGKKSKSKLKKLEELNKPTSVSMEGSQSESDSEEEVEIRIKSYIKELERIQKILNNNKDKTMYMVSLALQLFELPCFKDLYKPRLDITDQEQSRTFYLIMSELRTLKKSKQNSSSSSSTLVDEKEVSEQELLELLKNASIFGTEITGFFSDFQLQPSVKRVSSLSSSSSSSSVPLPMPNNSVLITVLPPSTVKVAAPTVAATLAVSFTVPQTTLNNTRTAEIQSAPAENLPFSLSSSSSSHSLSHSSSSSSSLFLSGPPTTQIAPLTVSAIKKKRPLSSFPDKKSFDPTSTPTDEADASLNKRPRPSMPE